MSPAETNGGAADRPAYFDRYETMSFERSAEGILILRLHTDGRECIFSRQCHREWAPAFADIGNDRDNRVVILTGSGSDFIAEWDLESIGDVSHPGAWDEIYFEGRSMLRNLLDIDVPIIGLVNGPALIHAELAVLSDIVLAAEHAAFQDRPHLELGIVPGDGVQVVWPEILGPNRGRYFLLTGQKLDAEEALRYGVVSEVLPASDLLDRGLELAGQLAELPPLTLRYSRLALTQRYKRRIAEGATLGLALEGLSLAALRPD